MKEIISFLAALLVFILIIWGGYILVDFITSTFKSDVAGDIFKIICFFVFGLPLVYFTFLIAILVYSLISGLFK